LQAGHHIDDAWVKVKELVATRSYDDTTPCGRAAVLTTRKHQLRRRSLLHRWTDANGDD